MFPGVNLAVAAAEAEDLADATGVYLVGDVLHSLPSFSAFGFRVRSI